MHLRGDLNQLVFKRDVHWGFLAQGLNVATGLLLLPMVLHYLSTEEVGLWFVFMSLAGLAQLLELGFQPTIARNVAYVYAGAQNLNAHGFTPNTEYTSLNIELLQQLYAAARKIYLLVACAALITLVFIGSAYIATLISLNMSLITTLLAWLVFVLGYVINFYFGYFNGFLQGRGDITAANKVIVAGRLAMIIFSGFFLAFGMGLFGLGVASLLSSAIGRFLAGKYFWRDKSVGTTMLAKIKASGHNPLISIIWPNASRFGLVGLGGFLITRANVLIASSFLGLAEAASYGLTFQILLAISGLAGVILNLNMPRLSGDQVRGYQERIICNFGKSLAAAWLIFIACVVFLILFGSGMLEMIASRTHLLSESLVVVFSIVMFLELNHSLCAVYLTTYNEILFVRAALVSGVCIVVASILFVTVWHFGVWGLVLSQGVVQVTYNNWRWPEEVAKRMGHSFTYVVISGFKGLWNVRNG